MEARSRKMEKIEKKIEEDELIPVETREDVQKLLSGSDEVKKKMYFKQLFKYLGGSDSPIEAMELALGRDKTLRDSQFSIMSIFSLWMDETNIESLRDYWEKRNVLELITSCNVAKFAVRLMLVNPKVTNGKAIINKHLHYHCLNVLNYVTDERYIMDKSERVKNIKCTQEHSAISRIVDYLDPKLSNPLAMFQASNVLKHFVTDSDGACVQIYAAAGLRRCLHLMTRKECEKMFMDYYTETCLSNASISIEESEIIEKFYSGKRSILRIFERFPRLTEYDHRRECLMHMAVELQENCAMITYKLAATNKLVRREILLLKPFHKVLNKWFNTPCIWRTERAMTQFCFNILRGVIEDAQHFIMSNDVIKNYNVLELIEKQIYNPDKDVLISVLNLLGVFARQYPECRKIITKSRILTKAMAIYINSYDDQIQIGALQTIITFAQVPATAKLVLDIGITAEKIYLLTTYNLDQLTEALKQMKYLMHKNCSTDMKESEKQFRISIHEERYNMKKALKYKEDGNTKFKDGKYETALKLYTLGLECVPPTDTFPDANPKDNSPWYALPSVLFTNRAQCYLTMKKWDEAVVDCTEAIIRSYESNSEAEKILFKTAYRRARGFLEIHDYQNALHDISFCYRKNGSAANVRSLFQEILTKYRKHFGLEPLRRCGACMDGVGMKLKRCAKCPEVYCSRACQSYAWDEGHKTNCNYTLEEKDNE